MHKTPDGESLQPLLGPFARVIELILELHGTCEQALAWLRAPHGELNERAPLSVMLEGRADVARDMLLGACAARPVAGLWARAVAHATWSGRFQGLRQALHPSRSGQDGRRSLGRASP